MSPVLIFMLLEKLFFFLIKKKKKFKINLTVPISQNKLLKLLYACVIIAMFCYFALYKKCSLYI